MTLARRVYRLAWWPMETRRERWIWRYGFAYGALIAIYNYRRIHQTKERR